MPHQVVVGALDVVGDALVAAQLGQRLARLPGGVDVRVALPLDVELAAGPLVGRVQLNALLVPVGGGPPGSGLRA